MLGVIRTYSASRDTYNGKLIQAVELIESSGAFKGVEVAQRLTLGRYVH